MYITCPSCSTSYEVDGTNIGHQGRAVRCFNCHHTWHQYPVAAPPPMRPVQPAPQISARYVPQSAQGYQPSAYAEPAYAAAPAYAAQPAYAMKSAPAAYAPPPMPEPKPVPMPAPVRAAPPPPPPLPTVAAPKPAPKPMPVEPLPSDKELDAMLGPIKEDAAARAFGGPSRDDTTALDEDAIAKLPDPEPMRQFTTDKKDDDFDDDIEPDDIPDPDPIPGVFAADDDDIEEKGSGLKKLIAPAITIIAIGAVVAGLIVGRVYVVALWPAANDYVYDLLGLHVAVPGDGLERKITRTAVETIANVDHVIATGFVTNTSDKEQPLPLVLVQLLDAKVQVLDTKIVKLEKTSLQPGETLQFKAVFEGAPATARTVRVEWGKFAEAMAE